MKLLFASDTFKGTLASSDIIALLTKAAKEIFEDCTCEGLCIADGGEGTLDAVLQACKSEKMCVKVHDPLMREVNTYYGKIGEEKALIEMALASGLTLVPEEKRKLGNLTTYGTGELIKAAIENGFKDITVAIGGSATNDGGMGCMRALGVKFLDPQGKELEGVGNDLAQVAHIDTSGMSKELEKIKFTVMCDVTNPLCGENGATFTFGKQKGGTPEELQRLEEGMCNYRHVLIKETGVDPDTISGAGAAGGLGAALCILLKGRLQRGIEAVLSFIDFDGKLEGVDLVVTGEGRADWQSCFGKVVQGVSSHCRRKGVPVLSIVGSMGEGAEDIYKYGVNSIMTTVNAPMPLREAMENAASLYYNAAIRAFRLIDIGRMVKR